MQTLGYAVSAFGPNIIEWLCMDKLLHRKNISTPVMLLLSLLSGLLITLQTQIIYGIIINALVSILAIFLFTFCYREPWLYRLFISFSIYVIALIAEGSSFLIARMFTPYQYVSGKCIRLFWSNRHWWHFIGSLLSCYCFSHYETIQKTQP